MPDIYIHARLAQDVANELTIETDPAIVSLGASGPDPMYFHVFHKNRSTYRMYADQLHDTNTKDYLKKMVRYVKQNYTVETYSYLMGFICHYAADVIIHPYIYYNVGIYDSNKPETKEYKGLHVRFERSVDTALIKEELHINPRKIDLTKAYFLVKESPQEVNKFMGHILNDRFKINDGEDVFKDSIKSMYRIIKYLNTDRTGIKKLVYSIIDLFVSNNDLYLKDLSFYKRDLSFDVLNKEKRTWYHPITNKPYDSSVIELYDQGKNFAIELITKVNMYLSGNNQVDLNTVFTNLSFNSGIACDHDEPFQYFHNYLKKTTK
jgi:hypothetical protein